MDPQSKRILLGALLGLVAAGANVLGGVLVAHRKWSDHFLKYFIAVGAGFMLATAVLEMIPESLALASEGNAPARTVGGDTSVVFLWILAGYFLVHFFEHTVAPHFHFGEEHHHADMAHSHASYAALLGAMTLLGMALMFLVRGSIGYALPISAGVTLYVAATDLVPESNREPGAGMGALVFLGVAIMVGLKYAFHF